VEEGEARLVELVVAGQLGHPADVAGQHPGPFDCVQRTIERPGDRSLDESLPKADPELASEDLDDVLRSQWVRAGQEIAEDRALGCGARRGLDRRVRRRNFVQ